MLEIKAFEAPEQDAPAGPQAHVAALPAPAFASCGSEKGICGLVTSILLFLELESNSHPEGIL